MGINKFITLIVCVIVAQSSFAQRSTNSCGIKSGVEDDLAVIQFGEDTANEALQRACTLIFTKLKSTLNEEVYGPEYKASRTTADGEIILEELVTAFMVGIVPTLEAFRTLQLDLEIEPRRNSSQTTLTNMSRSILRAIELIRSDNYCESRTGINREEKAVKAGAMTLISTGLFGRFRNLTDLTTEDRELLECYRETVTSEIINAFTAIFHAIRVALVQLSTGTLAESIESCMSIIEDAQAEASAYFKAEVTRKYIAVRNVFIAQFLKESGIMQGLFALQSVQTKPFAQLDHGKSR